MRTITRVVIASAQLIAVAPFETSTARPPNPSEDQTTLTHRQVVDSPVEAGRREPRQNPVAALTLGPAPRLDPITRFLPPIEPWVQSGLGWGDPAINESGAPVCSTNRPPRTTCDHVGPRPFVHAGFDAVPAADRSVKASAVGRVVFARASFASFAGGRDEAGGVVLVEHDLDGDPGTPDDRLVTIYEHVEPLVGIGAIVQQGDLIARSSTILGGFLHFGVRRTAFDPTNPDVFHSSLPPEGSNGCLPCYGRQLPLPAFPERWEDPAGLFRSPSYWAELLEGGDEGGGAVVETPDGFLVGGWTRPATIAGHGTDIWLVKLDADGNIRSQDSYDGSGDEAIRRLLPARDGGYVALAGSAGASGTSPLLVKFAADAETIEWQTRYVATGLDWGNDLRATSDGGYVIAGATDTCACGRRVATITKLDSGGGVQWARSYRSLSTIMGPPSTDAISIVEASNGDYVVAGTVKPGDLGATALLVFRVDATGNLIWSSELRANGQNTPGQIEATPDGGVAIVGSSSGPLSGFGVLWFLKLRADGSLERDSLYGPLSFTTGTRLVVMPDGGYVLAGRIFEYGFDEHADPRILRLDASGQIVEQRTFDGRSLFDDVTGLISTRDGGFILTGGHSLVVKMSPDLHVSHGCEKETQAILSTRVSSVAQEPLLGETLTVLASPTNLTKAETAAVARACNEGAYGPPPVFHSASVQVNERSVACDFTHMLETFFCSAGVPGTEAIQPVVLSGSYDHLEIEAHVTDLDSIPEQNDVVDVHAELYWSEGSPFIVPLVDDGSSQIVLRDQVSPFLGEDCFDDPLQGVCVCNIARYPIASGDDLPGDAVYSHRDALMSIAQLRFLVDCAMKSDHLSPLPVLPGSNLEISLQAKDRIGNVAVWPEPIHLTTGINSRACSGDPCGCCLLFAYEQQVEITKCAGLEGMPSPTFPCGFCVQAFGGSCPP